MNNTEQDVVIDATTGTVENNNNNTPSSVPAEGAIQKQENKNEENGENNKPKSEKSLSIKISRPTTVKERTNANGEVLAIPVEKEIEHTFTLVERELARAKNKSDEKGTYFQPTEITYFADFEPYAGEEWTLATEKEAVTAMFKLWSRAIGKDGPLPTAEDVLQRMVNSIQGERGSKPKSLLQRLIEEKDVVTKEFITLKKLKALPGYEKGSKDGDELLAKLTKLMGRAQDLARRIKEESAKLEDNLTLD